MTSKIEKRIDENNGLFTEVYSAQLQLDQLRRGGPIVTAPGGEGQTGGAGAAEDGGAVDRPPAAANADLVTLRVTVESKDRLLRQGDRDLTASFILLEDWSTSWLNVLGPAGLEQGGWFESEQDMIAREARNEQLKDSSREIALAYAKSSLHWMLAYILPLLYGLVGASAYVLRAISRDLKDVTFSAEAAIQYRLRVILGTLSGLAVGWFVTPEQLSAGVAGIQPLALAFLAGYSVELLFSALDQLIGAFSAKEARAS